MAERTKKPGSEGETSTNTPQTNTNNASMPSYLEASLRLSTSHPLGAKRADTIEGLTDFAFGGPLGVEPVPGICVLDYVPTLGVSTDATSALNRASNYDFNIIRSAISGNRPYESPDAMIQRMCVDGLRDLYIYIARVYAIISGYSATNMYRPKQILSAMGLDANDWIAHASELYQWLKQHRNALIPFPTVPIGTISARHNVYNAVIFTDGDIDSTQMYILNQVAFPSYEVVDQVKGITMVKPGTTFESFTTCWDDMYTAMLSSTDVYIISADIRRAFGDRVVTELPDVDVNATVQYVKNDMALMSIMNASIFPTSEYATFRIYDGGGNVLKCTPAFSASLYLDEDYGKFAMEVNHINSIAAAPDARTILESVRLRPAVKTTNSFTADIVFTQNVEFIAMGTEVIVGMHIWGFDSYGSVFRHDFGTFNPVPSGSGYVAMDLAAAMSDLANFDWHPLVMVGQLNASSASTGGVANFKQMEDIQNYIPVSRTQLKDIHEANILAEFGF